MDPKLKEQLFIRKHSAGIIIIIILILILPLLLIFPQTGTQYRQQAAEIVKNPNSSSNPALTGSTQEDYSIFIKCFDKPNRTPIISGQTNPCSPTQHKAADLNNDGIVDGIDYNLFIHKKTGQK